MDIEMNNPLNYLCPECRGYGQTGGEYVGGYGYGADPGAYADMNHCFECDGSGVIQATFEEGIRLGLHRWGSDVGRAACRGHRYYRDPLELMRSNRKPVEVKVIRNGWASCYKSSRIRAMHQSIGFTQLAMCERAIKCDVAARQAADAWRRAA